MSNYITRYVNEPFTTEIVPVVCPSSHLPQNANGVRVKFAWPGFVRSFEAITPNSSRDKRSWKSFQHYKRSVAPTSGVVSSADINIHVGSYPHDYDYVASTNPYAFYCNEFGSAGVHNNGLQVLYDSSMDFGFVPNPDDLDNLIQKSLNSMMPWIKSDLSLVNSVIELKDFKTLPKTLSNFVKLGNWLRSVRRVSTTNINATLRRLLHSTADGYLQLEFNILPLLSDIVGLSTALSQTRAQINALVSGQGQTQKKHYRVPLNVDSNDPAVTTYQSGGDVDDNDINVHYPWHVVSHANRYVYTDTAVFHAEVVYNYNFTQYQVEHAQLLGLLDRLGVNLNPAIIWNAIPWSFVVDWFVGISRWLNNRRTLNMEPVINIQNYLWSVTYRRRILVARRLERRSRFYEFSPADTITAPSVSLPVVTESAYRRDVGLPSVGSFTTSGLSLKEFSLGSALIITSGSHHKRNQSR